VTPELLLLIGAVRHYGWFLVDPTLAGMAAKGLGGMAILALLWITWRRERRTWLTDAVLAWWAWEELQVVVCSAWYIADPWEVEAGQAICSARAGIDFGAFGILIVALLLWRVSTIKPDRLE
jgi:hypothetical protein